MERDVNSKGDAMNASLEPDMCNRRQLISSIGGGCAAYLFSGVVTKTNVANAEETSKLSLSSQAKLSVEVKTQSTPAMMSEAKTTAIKNTTKKYEL